MAKPSGHRRPDEVIDLLSSDEEDDSRPIDDRPKAANSARAASVGADERRSTVTTLACRSTASIENRKRISGRKRSSPTATSLSHPLLRQFSSSSRDASSRSSSRAPLQAGIILEEDTLPLAPSSSSSSSAAVSTAAHSAQSYIDVQLGRKGRSLPPILYHDAEFRTVPSSIDGANKSAKSSSVGGGGSSNVEKCRCSPPRPAVLAYSTRPGPNYDRPYYRCARGNGSGNGSGGCKHFRWAYTSHLMQWYRFGLHSSHVLVGPGGFRADDLLQGKVGDCWFLSALAVVAERPDLISRLFEGCCGCSTTTTGTVGGGGGGTIAMNEFGIVQVRLFVDGFWTNVVIDNFLPCLIDEEEEDQLSRAIRASLGGDGHSLGTSNDGDGSSGDAAASSEHDPHVISDENRRIIIETNAFLEQDRFRKNGPYLSSSGRRSRYERPVPRRLNRAVTSNDLAYSKAEKDQLWVPLLEKAYSKVHGCYKAISGGHISEAFLDLTGAPTLVYDFDSPNFHARSFWSDLLSYRDRRLPMGCGTSTSQAGIVGMHAYSILDVREIGNVGLDFFRDKLVSGTMGNVSGFTDFDGTVRLLRIRNPHGKGEWKGEFSDGSAIWERLLANRGGGGSSNVSDGSSPGLHRTMKNDGTFWIDYDNFLMGFSNVDVVLAFEGNHAMSFATNFPAKKSNHRCARAFEVSLIEPQPGIPSRDTVELYVMGIQKNRRGAYHGRADRKKSYKVCDLGMIVGENLNGKRDAFEDDGGEGCAEIEFDTVEGKMFGFKRNGHYRLTLDRKKNKSLVVMPISFGHPAATDKELSFVLRFVSDAPLLIRELPRVPRMDTVMQKLCLRANLVRSTDTTGASRPSGVQGTKRILLDDLAGTRKYGEPLFRVFLIDYLGNEGGIVFVYFNVNGEAIARNGLKDFAVSFSIVASCRGMVCRTEDGLLQHETVAKGKKFEAAWRRFTSQFNGERNSRLLMTLVQSGQSTKMGSVQCDLVTEQDGSTTENAANSLTEFLGGSASPPKVSKRDDYEKYGIFNTVMWNGASGCGFDLSEPPRGGETICLPGSGEPADSDLERALALSRGDLELKETMERSTQMSRNPTPAATSFNQDMERAIAASMRETSAPAATRFSHDLEKAMKLSLQESKDPANGDNELVDLASSPAAKASLNGSLDGTRRKANKNAIEIVGDETDKL